MERQILVVENGAKPSEEFRAWAMTQEINAVFTGSGAEALQWLGKGNIPDLVFVEAEMMGIPGVPFVQHLKTVGFFQDIPIVVFGNPDKHETIAAMLQAGASDHLIRPFSVEAIRQRTDRFLTVQSVA